ncbi:hypothetical protein CTAYLR_004697 [Chrysophaeum taylorii]|uniref:AMP-dependent synthetase/ligase domain-containing protein n=1 Tax=Chrysophaeum taylorii TaxID=2483200 RepID=A0AAD7XFR5_9STRA|nr:hypothetical protein CTAYLR_004697 [Chrysophaeum taylorii]
MEELRSMWRSRKADDVVLGDQRWAQVDKKARSLAGKYRSLGGGDGYGVRSSDDVIGFLACIMIGAPWCPAGEPAVEDDQRRQGKRYPPDALYVLTTSGSTGEPKEIIGSAAMTVERLKWASGPILRRTPVVFVDSIAEMLQVLVSRVVLGGRLTHLFEDCARLGAERLTLTPSLLAIALRTSRADAALAVHASGEPLPMWLVRDFREKLPNSTLVNVWGSAELSADVTFCDVTALECPECLARPVAPIGRPFRDTITVTPDLVVTGCSAVGLPETLRSGDLGDACKTCGNLVCLGRDDDVVNVAGIKVNLKLLEAQLGAPCVFLAHRDPSKQCIVVFSTRDIAVPGYCVLKKQEPPLLPTGKVDRQRLKIDAVFPPGEGTFRERGGTSLLAIEAAYRLGVSPAEVLDMPAVKRQKTRQRRRRVVVVDLGGCVDANPLVADDDAIYVGAHSTRFCKISFQGEILWERTVGAQKSGDAALEAGAATDGTLVFVGAYDGRLYCFSSTTGDLQWTYQAGGEIKNAALVLEDDVYVGSHDARVHRVSKLGKQIWATQVDGPVYGTPAKHTEILYATITGSLGGLGDDGQHVWRARATAPIFGALTVFQDHILYGAVDGIQTSHGKWNFMGSAAVFAPVRVVERLAVFVTNDGAVVARDLSSGITKWRCKIGPHPIFAAPCVADRLLFVVDTQGTLAVVSSRGEVQTRRTIGGEVYSSPALLPNGTTLVVGCRDTNSLHWIDVL